jgi:hypothetical protein
VIDVTGGVVLMEENMNVGPTYIFYNDIDIRQNYQMKNDSKLEGELKNLIDVINMLSLKVSELEEKTNS